MSYQKFMFRSHAFLFDGRISTFTWAFQNISWIKKALELRLDIYSLPIQNFKQFFILYQGYFMAIWRHYDVIKTNRLCKMLISVFNYKPRILNWPLDGVILHFWPLEGAPKYHIHENSRIKHVVNFSNRHQSLENLRIKQKT